MKFFYIYIKYIAIKIVFFYVVEKYKKVFGKENNIETINVILQTIGEKNNVKLLVFLYDIIITLHQSTTLQLQRFDTYFIVF